MAGSRWLSLLAFLLAAFPFGNAAKTGRGDGLCLYGSIKFDGGYREELEFRKPTERCLCFYEVVCEDPKDPDCRVVKHLQFGCDKEIQGDHPQNSTILDGRLKVHFRHPNHPQNGSTLDEWDMKHPYFLILEILSAKEAFLNNLAIARRNGPNDVDRARMARRMLKMWSAGLFSVYRKHPGGAGRIHYDSDLGWLPLATSFVLLVISAVLFFVFKNYDKRKGKGQPVADQ